MSDFPRPRRRFSQNFLQAPEIARRIVDAAEMLFEDEGFLGTRIAEGAKKVAAAATGVHV